MSTPQIGERPGGGLSEAFENVHGQANTPSVPRPADPVDPALDGVLVDPASRLTGVYVLLLTIDQDHTRRRCYFNLPSAQRAADKAEDAGHVADIILCALDPVGRPV
jgi:hypothetical protein